MNADERLAQIRLKVERAKKHLADLEVARDGFIETKPYRVGAEFDAQTGQTVYKVCDLQAPPAHIGLVAGDAIHNLRSALDHLAYQLVLVNGGTPSKRTAFPIYDDAAKYKSLRGGQVQGMSQLAIDVIDGVAPYKGSDDTLWGLHALDIADKHHALLLTLVNVTQISFEVPSGLFFGRRGVRQSFGGFSAPNFGKPLEDGDVILVRESDMQYEPEFAFDVAFAEPEVVKGYPLLPTLSHTADAVEHLLLKFRPLL